MASFGSRLKELRTANRCGQKELGALIGVSDSSIRKYESGDRTPTPEAIRTLAKYFNVSTDYLLGNAPTNNINIETNNGAVSGSGNVTYVKESHVTYGAVQSECMRLIEALFGDSPEALSYIKSLKISQSGKIEGLENIDVASKALLDGARTTWIAALRNALEKGTDRGQIPV